MAGAGTVTGLPPAPAYKLPGVRLFASGVYRGQPWSPEKVRAITATTRALGPSGKDLLIPPAVLGHEEDQEWLDRTDLPAAGWVDPDTVHDEPDPDNPGHVIQVGDVVNIPPPVAQRLWNGEYKHCSAEFYEPNDDFGKPQGLTLRRLAFLGGEIPQVKRLGRLPMPVPMDAAKQFAEAATALRPCKTRFVLSYSERSFMDRTSAYAAIQAAMPGLSQAFLDGLSDDALKELVANIPSGTPAAAPASGTAAMDDTGTSGTAPATPSRDDMIAQLVAAGQDQAEVSGLSDSDLAARYAQVCGGAAATASPETSTMSDPKKVACMSETEKKAAASLQRIKDLEKAAANREQATKERAAASFCEDMVRQGRILPYEKADYAGILSRLDDTAKVCKFSENGVTTTLTAFERKKREIAGRPAKITFGERGLGSTTTPSTKDAEVGKVQKFCEVNGAALRATGTDPKKMVDQARAMAERNPDFKAADLIGKDGAAMVG
jgi:hypothetical protein